MTDDGAALTEIGRRAAWARQRAGLTQSQVAAAVGLQRTSVANLEAGRQDIPVTRLLAFADALGVSPHELLPDGGCRAHDRLVAELIADRDEMAGRLAQAAAILAAPFPRKPPARSMSAAGPT